MNDPLLKIILENANSAIAVLDATGAILQTIGPFSDFCLRKSENIFECLPEMVGMEGIVAEISYGKKQKLKLEQINRNDRAGVIHYFDLSLFHLQQKEPGLLCILSDTNKLSQYRQQLVQQENEIGLLKSRLANINNTEQSPLIGQSTKIQILRETVQRIGQIPNVTILLTGESGTGKNLIAREIHRISASAEKALVEINCAAIPDHLLESELFGYEKGAFTNATNSKAGLLEEAHQGTLFLDEIGELPLSLQAKLLHVIESHRFRRLGSNQERTVEFRLISATNQDLGERVKQKLFREDLLFRLNVVQIELPPLRTLDSDIILIADYFIHFFNLKFNKKVSVLSPEAIKAIEAYSWPGNVRELSNCIERAMIFNDSTQLEVQNLIFQNQFPQAESVWEVPQAGLQLKEVEKELIRSALKRSNGNKVKAAQLLGLTRDTLRYRMEKYQLS